MEELTVQLILRELDDIKKQNDRQTTILEDHVKDGHERLKEIHEAHEELALKVDRHSTYFKFAWLGVPTALAYVFSVISSKLGLPK